MHWKNTFHNYIDIFTSTTVHVLQMKSGPFRVNTL